MRKNIIFVGVFALTLLISSCGEDSIAKQTGKTVGNTIREFAEGAGGELNEKKPVTVKEGEKFKASGLSITTANIAGSSKDCETIEVCIKASQPLNCTLRLTALNKTIDEVGRATLVKEFAADSASYETFTFPSAMSPKSVSYYQIDVYPAPSVNE